MNRPFSPPPRFRCGWPEALIIIALALELAVALLSHHFPYQDPTNHLARYTLIDRIWFGDPPGLRGDALGAHRVHRGRCSRRAARAFLRRRRDSPPHRRRVLSLPSRSACTHCCSTRTGAARLGSGGSAVRIRIALHSRLPELRARSSGCVFCWLALWYPRRDRTHVDCANTARARRRRPLSRAPGGAAARARRDLDRLGDRGDRRARCSARPPSGGCGTHGCPRDSHNHRWRGDRRGRAASYASSERRRAAGRVRLSSARLQDAAALRPVLVGVGAAAAFSHGGWATSRRSRRCLSACGDTPCSIDSLMASGVLMFVLYLLFPASIPGSGAVDVRWLAAAYLLLFCGRQRGPEPEPTAGAASSVRRVRAAHGGILGWYRARDRPLTSTSTRRRSRHVPPRHESAPAGRRRETVRA